MEANAVLIERWVKPLYVEVLGANQSPVVTQQLKEACDTVTSETVSILLADLNWRCRKMAAIYAGINGLVHLTDAIGESLLRSEVTYAGKAYCFALARFGSEGAVAYLKKYLDVWLMRPECWYDQSHALSALLWLDQTRGSNEAAIYLSVDGLWQRFVANKPRWDLQRTSLTFFETMAFCQEQFSL